MILTDSTGAKAWPIAGATFILVPKQPKDPAAASEALKFFAWAYKSGGKMAEDLDYIPMPATVVKLIEANWSKDVKDGTGKPIF
jgi:phosphate transport system substrate-binding protein